MSLRVPHSKYFRRRLFDRMRHARQVGNFITDVLVTLDETETAQTVAPVRTTNTKAEALVVMGSQPASLDTLRIDSLTYQFRTALSQVKASGVLTAAGNPANDDTVTLGDTTYTVKTALTEVKANADLVTDTTNAANLSTVTIGSIVYTFQTVLTPGTAGQVHVLIGANAAASLLNLTRSILATGGTPGTDYSTTGTGAHPDVTSSASVTGSTTITVTAKVVGTAGNAIGLVASTSPDSHIDPESATLTGGVAAVANQVLRGGSASDSLDNLIAAINGAAGSGSTYSTGTVANTQAAAAAGTGDTLDATALSFGVAGNLIVKSEASSVLDWDGTGGFLTGGVDAIAYEVLRGADAAASLANVISAINGSAGSGSTYSSGTVAHPLVVASAATNDLLLTAASASIAGKDVKLAKSSAGLTLPTLAQLDGPGWTATSHTFVEGEGPVLLTTTTTLPAGSPAAGTQLWVHVINANRIALATSLDAMRDGIYIQTTSAGTGTHSVTRSVTAKGIFDTLKRNKPRTVAVAEDIDSLQ